MNLYVFQARMKQSWMLSTRVHWSLKNLTGKRKRDRERERERKKERESERKIKKWDL